MRTLIILLTIVTTMMAHGEDDVWPWGWGIYGGGGSVLDTARFDWSIVRFGNQPADQRTVDRCNATLELNPNHKFFVRVWPISGVGKLKENKHQATFLEVYFRASVREQVHRQIHQQVRLILDGIAKPEAVVGFSFLEELPSHFSAIPLKHWRKGAELPWDIAQFEEEISAELGGQRFDPSNWTHREWWGRTYTKVLGDINREIKKASDNRPVYYWQATAFWTLDQVDADNRMRNNTLPFTYADVLKPDQCDGIFAYPNNRYIWDRQTVAVTKQYNCPFFSQLSTPSGMRLTTFDDMVQMTCEPLPGNQGAFLYMMAGRGRNVWNELPFMADSGYWTVKQIARQVAWDYKIGLDIVDRHLGPEIELDYSFVDKQPGDFVHVFAQVTNPRDPTWYGGDGERAWLRDVTVSLAVPNGLSIPKTNNGNDPLSLGDIAPNGAKTGEWWVHMDDADAIPMAGEIKVKVEARGVSSQTCTSRAISELISGLQAQLIDLSGYRWVEPRYSGGAFEPRATVVPLLGDLLFPQLDSGGMSALYRHKLTSDTWLEIGPGYRARLHPKDLIVTGDTLPVSFSEEYIIATYTKLPVRPETDYRLRVEGSVQAGANLMAMVVFSGKHQREPFTKTHKVLIGALGKNRGMKEAVVTAPTADSRPPLTATIRLYRLKEKGTIHLHDIGFSRADLPLEGQDVTARLEGELPRVHGPFTLWSYTDRSDPDRWSRPKVQVTLSKP